MLVCNASNLGELLSAGWEGFCHLPCCHTVSMDAQHRSPDAYPDVTKTQVEQQLCGKQGNMRRAQAVEPGHHQELELI